ncbi:hypothetical protein [Candidatus Burkholderia verschuerenii]|uniref:hypothetical protein n=1 Tax=Candidatus Burkholderia verschuerenii TaxID=242163 RepID=UPI001E599600|nr:hypothetical protein [Candidatus Burkholderia verschuerenii]
MTKLASTLRRQEVDWRQRHAGAGFVIELAVKLDPKLDQSLGVDQSDFAALLIAIKRFGIASESTERNK